MTTQNENKRPRGARTRHASTSSSLRVAKLSTTATTATVNAARRAPSKQPSKTPTKQRSKTPSKQRPKPTSATPNPRKRKSSSAIDSRPASITTASATKRARLSRAAKTASEPTPLTDDSSGDDYSEDEGDHPDLIHDIEEGDGDEATASSQPSKTTATGQARGAGRKKKTKPSSQGILTSGSAVPVNDGGSINLPKAPKSKKPAEWKLHDLSTAAPPPPTTPAPGHKLPHFTISPDPPCKCLQIQLTNCIPSYLSWTSFTIPATAQHRSTSL
ncbi:hypothetical protein BCR44DRAFT_1175520 [Catenaria anguillulae PL171]|uniref:Uncharacterized protein n=1 Tax=Catenaria anguillulae PL171 TaxID=765915 RepID=A0A1Y2I0V9_9FUNG|nr:hypothetical protein BCR44DRAFT_1175520 [Catenaria anguillulae PL171]